MDIQQYYQYAASIRLNGSIVSAGMLAFILSASLWLPWNVPFLVVAAPFLTICFSQYNSFLLYRNKSEVSKATVKRYGDKDFLEQNHLLIAFAPAPALRMMFFTPDGMLSGELKELEVKKWRWLLPDFLDRKIPKDFGIYDSDGELQAILISDGKKTKILNKKREVLGFFYPHKKKDGSIGNAILDGGSRVFLRGKPGLNPELLLVKDKGIVGSRLQIGWMPLEWTHTFKKMDTPVLSFDYDLSIPERLAVFAVLAHHYKYHDH
jgi:hypothetical protein